jgi:ribose transport system substrate-binding protein
MSKRTRKTLLPPLLALVGAVAIAVCGAATAGASTNYGQLLKQAKTVVPAKYAGPTTPAPAPKGIKLAAISCSQQLEGCVLLAKGLQSAGKTAGWSVRTFDGKGDSSDQNSQILNAVQWGAKVIVLEAIDPSTVQTGLAAAKKAGALIVGTSNGLSSPNPTVKAPKGDIWPAYDVSVNFREAGIREADWIIADSKGKAHTLVYGDKEFLSVVAQQPGVLAALRTCPGCKTYPVINFTASQIATTLGSEVVSDLRTHPDVNYIFCPYDPSCPAMVTAIQSAGMASRVKIVSLLGNAQNLGFVKNGQVQLADGGFDQNYMAYATVDQAIRLLDHKSLFQPLGENVPYQLITKSNVPKNGQAWAAPYNFQAKYAALWKRK